MSIVRELVTVLKYELEEGKLRQYREGWQSTVQSFRDGARQMQGAQQGVNTAIQSGTRNANVFGNTLRRAIGFFGALYGVREIFRNVDAWGQLESRLKSATASVEEYQQADAELARISRLTYKSFESSAELFIRTRRTLQDLGRSTQDTIDLTEALSLGMTLSSTKAEYQESAISALSKAVMQGKMSYMQYSTIMTTMPRLHTALADGLGVTIDELDRMVRSGQITTDKLLPALQSQLEGMRLEAEKMPVTIKDAAQVWRDAFQRMVGNATISRKVVMALTKSIEFLADNIGKVTVAVGILAGAYGLMRLNRMIVNFSEESAYALGRWMRFVIILTAIYLIAQDIYVWLKGGQSVLGEMIGPVEEWKDELEFVKGVFSDIGRIIKAVTKSFGPLIAQVIGLTTVVWGLVKAFQVLRIASLLALGPIGWAIALLISAALVVIARWERIWGAIKFIWNDIKDFFGGVWDWITEGFDAAVQAVMDAFTKLGNWIDKKMQEAANAIRKTLSNIPGYEATLNAGNRAVQWLSGEDTAAQRRAAQAALESQVSGMRITAARWRGAGNVTVQQHNEFNIQGGDPVATGRAVEQRQNVAAQRTGQAVLSTRVEAQP